MNILLAIPICRALPESACPGMTPLKLESLLSMQSGGDNSVIKSSHCRTLAYSSDPVCPRVHLYSKLLNAIMGYRLSFTVQSQCDTDYGTKVVCLGIYL